MHVKFQVTSPQSTASLQVHPRLVCEVSNSLQPCCTLGDRQMVWYSQIADFLLLPSLCLFGYLHSPSTFLLPQSIMGFDWYGFLKSTPVRLKLAPPPSSLPLGVFGRCIRRLAPLIVVEGNQILPSDKRTTPTRLICIKKTTPTW